MESMNQMPSDAHEQSLSELVRYEKKNLRINRIRLACSLLCLVLLVAIALVLSMNVGKIYRNVEDVTAVMTDAGKSINEVAESLNEIDFEALSSSVQTFTTVGTETIEQIKTATEGLDTMLDDVHEAVIRIGNVNIDDLNNGIKTLNDVLEPIARFFNAFK